MKKVDHIVLGASDIDANRKWYEDLPENGEHHEHRDGTIGVYKQDLHGNWVEFIRYSEQAKTLME